MRPNRQACPNRQALVTLRVRLVLEGSVRRQGERVRITAQLIDAAPGYHLWSQTFDRDLKDIFAIQDEIARAIGAEMKVRLTGMDESGTTQRGTTHIGAYDAYLRGLTLWQTRRDQALWDAVAAFESAIAMDPEFSQPYGGLAMTYAVMSDYSSRITWAQATARGLDTAERALARDPLLPEAYAALGNFAAFEGRFHTGIDLLQRAIALRPSFATGHQWLAFPLESSGDLDGAIRSAQHALELDPRSEIIANNVSQLLMFAGRNAEAIAVCQQVFGFAPESSLCLEAIAQGHLLQGDLAAARRCFDRWAAAWGSGSAQVAEVFDALAGQGNRQLAAQRLAATNRIDAFDPTREILLQEAQIPVVLVMLGENDLALDWIERQTNAGSYAGWGLGQPVLDPIRCEPRFIAAQKKMKRVYPRAPTVCASKT